MKLPVTLSQSFQNINRGHFGFRRSALLSSFSIFATVLSLGLIGVDRGCAAATGASTKHRVAATRTKAKSVTSGTQPSPVKAASPQAVLPPPNRIHNMMLPVPTITERLIRDIMVGKPQEVAPPAGTEAFSTEGTPPAPNGQPAADGSSAASPPATSSDTTNAPGAPSAEATPPKSDTDAATPAAASDGAAPPTSEVTSAGATTPASESPSAGATSPASESPSAGATNPASEAPSASATNPASETPSASAATPASDAPSGMAPDAVVAPKPEVKPDEAEKPLEKSALPGSAGNLAPNLCEAPSLHERLSIADPPTAPSTASTAPTPAEDQSSAQVPAPVSDQATASNYAQVPAPVSDQATTLDSAQATAFDSARVSAEASTQSSAQAPSFGSTPPVEETHERISIDGLEGATYAVKTNGGFGSAMVSRQSIPVEAAVPAVTSNQSPQNMSEAQEVDLDSAVAQPNPSANEAVLAQPTAAVASGEETVVDAAATANAGGTVTDASAAMAGNANNDIQQVLPQSNLESATAAQ